MYFIIFVLEEVLGCSVAARLLPLMLKPKQGGMRQVMKCASAALLQDLQPVAARGFALGVLTQKRYETVGMRHTLCAALLGQMCERFKILGHGVMLPSSETVPCYGKKGHKGVNINLTFRSVRLIFQPFQTPRS